MIRNILFPLIALTLATGGLHAADTLKIDSKKSKVTFSIMNTPPGAAAASEVPGSFKDFSGTIVIDDADPSKSSVEMEIKTTSVDTANEKRDAHLRNQDFFKVKEYPTMKFKSKSVKKADDGKFEITGDLTLLDKTKEITVTFEKTGDNAGKTSFQIKRSDYGMDYRVPDTADEVDITLDIVAAAAK
jgi:polyisoprenoid-binding protein YceI